MSNRRQSPIEELLARFIELPFWASVVGAAFGYLALRFVAPLFAGSSLTGKALAPLFPTIALWLAIAILTAGLIGVGKRRWRRALFSRTTGIQALKQMTWQDFELLVGEAYRRQGYSVRERGAVMPTVESTWNSFAVASGSSSNASTGLIDKFPSSACANSWGS